MNTETVIRGIAGAIIGYLIGDHLDRKRKLKKLTQPPKK